MLLFCRPLRTVTQNPDERKVATTPPIPYKHKKDKLMRLKKGSVSLIPHLIHSQSTYACMFMQTYSHTRAKRTPLTVGID